MCLLQVDHCFSQAVLAGIEKAYIDAIALSTYEPSSFWEMTIVKPKHNEVVEQLDKTFATRSNGVVKEMQCTKIACGPTCS